MPTYAIGDIHGCRTALDALLDAVGPRPRDTVVTLGDYVDVGPDTRGVLDRLLELGKATQHVALRGNHDQMMLEARASRFALELWRSIGGARTLESYGSLDGVPETHWIFLESTRHWHETSRHIFVHGGLDADRPPSEQPPQIMHWMPVDACPPHGSGRSIICGHTRQASGLPLDRGHAVCIDTGVESGGWLTCMNLSGGDCVQTNERGEVREFNATDVPWSRP